MPYGHRMANMRASGGTGYGPGHDYALVKPLVGANIFVLRLLVYDGSGLLATLAVPG